GVRGVARERRIQTDHGVGAEGPLIREPVQRACGLPFMLALVLITEACTSRPANPLQRVALLPLENLTADASLDWIASADPKIAAGEVAGAAHSIPVFAPALRDAIAANCVYYVHGYFDHRGQALHFEFSIENAATHKMTQTLALEGAPLNVADSLAKAI